MTGFYKFALGIVRFVMRLSFKIETEGMENVPRESGYLYISNHHSNADPVLIGMQNKETQFCFLAKKELFSSKAIGWLLRKLGGVAIDRGSGNTDALDEIADRLRNGENALVFPEGTRSKDGKLLRFKTGAALIAAQANAPVIPVAISFEGKLHFRSRIVIRYGAPYRLPSIDLEKPSPALLKEIRHTMTDSVAGLLDANQQNVQAALPDKEEPVPSETEIKKETQESEDTENK